MPNSEIEFSELESCIIALNYTVNYLRNIIEIQDEEFDEMNKIIDDFGNKKSFEQIPKGMSKKEAYDKAFLELSKKPEIKKIQTISGILHNCEIIYLYNLTKIHSRLVIHLKNMGEMKLEKALHSFWKPIQDLEPRIRNWRNKIVAHAEDLAEKHTALYDIDRDYDKFSKELFFASLCGVMYCSGISANLPEYSSTIDSHRRQIQYEKNAFKIVEWFNVHNDFYNLTEKVKQDLKNNGYVNYIEFFSYRKYPRKFE